MAAPSAGARTVISFLVISHLLTPFSQHKSHLLISLKGPTVTLCEDFYLVLTVLRL